MTLKRKNQYYLAIFSVYVTRVFNQVQMEMFVNDHPLRMDHGGVISVMRLTGNARVKTSTVQVLLAEMR